MSVDAFLQAIAAGDAERAHELHRADPTIAAANLHVAAALGDEDAVRRHLADGARLDAKAGDPPGDPLLWLCYSPFDGLEATARVLLDAGADPNTRDGGRYNLPALYAVTGHRNVPRIARLLLEAGADPNDGESAFHAAERFHVEALELLLEYGAELLAHGADTGIEDPEHHSSPLGWAEFGREMAIDPDGDYEAAIRALSADTPPAPRRRR